MKSWPPLGTWDSEFSLLSGDHEKIELCISKAEDGFEGQAETEKYSCYKISS